MTKPNAIIICCEGTLFNLDHRRKYIDPDKNPIAQYGMIVHGNSPIPTWINKQTGDRWKPQWDEFHEASRLDTPYANILEILKCLKDKLVLCFIADRPPSKKAITERQLEKWGCAKFGKKSTSLLFLRHEFDNRTLSQFKRETFLTNIQPHYNVIACLESRLESTDMWADLGLHVLFSSGEK